eukprot:m.197059 g.197059  ORF g.197059 m.197059 type:complete len:580 (-) comp19982_c0_seq1:119-1858(-)
MRLLWESMRRHNCVGRLVRCQTTLHHARMRTLTAASTSTSQQDSARKHLDKCAVAAGALAAVTGFVWTTITTRVAATEGAESSSDVNTTEGASSEADGNGETASTADLPVYKRADVAEHDTLEKGVWVTYNGEVFDITNFVVNHPGGKSKIMLAAGKDIGPFWRVYQQHTRKGGLPLELLERMKIGVLDPSEPAPDIDSADPYAGDPIRHPGLMFHNNKPANAELPPELLMDSWITPNELFFIRHHHPVPIIDPGRFRLSVTGIAVKPIVLDLEDLRERFPKNEVVATIQCGGNRRGEFNKTRPTSGISWGFGAMSTAKFGGVLLRDILLYSGLLKPETAESLGVRHVQFISTDGLMASIPIHKALYLFGDVLIAYEMNGVPLPPEHGGPLRAIVPGHVGVRNVKWVERIVTSGEEAEGPWQRGISYKGFAPGVTSFEGVDVEAIQSIQEQPVTSAIIEPQSGSTYEPGQPIDCRGFAWSGGGRGIVRVDVSADGGKTWTTAKLTEGAGQPSHRAWAWTFWEAEVPCPPGNGEVILCCKATDASYNSQPENPDSIWNIRGLNNNSWHKVLLHADEDEDE